MARTPIWKHIAGTLEGEMREGLYHAGGKLPTEAALAARFGVNRHTVRRALGDLVERGLVYTRRGSGAFVAQEVTDYPIGKRVRFHQNVSATGKLVDKKRLRVETRPARNVEAEALGLASGDPVVVYEGLSRSGGAVLAHFESIFSAERLPGLADTFLSETSVTKALRANGIPDYLRAQTRVTAELADPALALHLGVREREPILRTRAINTTPEGDPLEYGVTSFAGSRVALTIESD
jgi:GntR family phosphonate transport system transcriptional regulator